MLAAGLRRSNAPGLAEPADVRGDRVDVDVGETVSVAGQP